MDVADNFGRSVYRGFLYSLPNEEEPKAGMVFRLKKTGMRGETESAIEWFRVDDRSAGEELLVVYAEMCWDENIAKTTFAIPVKDKQTEKELLKDTGFSVLLTEGDNILVELSEMSALKLMSKRVVPSSIRPLKDLGPDEYRRGILECVQAGKTGLCEDLESLPKSWFEPDVSCYSEKNGAVNGLLLFHRLPSGIISIQLMVGLDADYQKVLIGLIRCFIISMEEKYPPDTKILLNRHNQSSLMLTENMFPRSFGIPVYSGSREETDI